MNCCPNRFRSCVLIRARTVMIIVAPGLQSGLIFRTCYIFIWGWINFPAARFIKIHLGKSSRSAAICPAPAVSFPVLSAPLSAPGIFVRPKNNFWLTNTPAWEKKLPKVWMKLNNSGKDWKNYLFLCRWHRYKLSGLCGMISRFYFF